MNLESLIAHSHPSPQGVWGGEQTSPPSDQLETVVSAIRGCLPEAHLQSPCQCSCKETALGSGARPELWAAVVSWVGLRL